MATYEFPSIVVEKPEAWLSELIQLVDTLERGRAHEQDRLQRGGGAGPSFVKESLILAESLLRWAARLADSCAVSSISNVDFSVSYLSSAARSYRRCARSETRSISLFRSPDSAIDTAYMLIG